MNADPNGMTGEKEKIMFFKYNSQKPMTAAEANDMLRGELAKGRKTYLSVTNEDGKTVAWINGNGKNGSEKNHFLAEENNTEETKTAEDIKAAVEEKAAADMSGKKVASKKEAIKEKEPEEEAKEDTMENRIYLAETLRRVATAVENMTVTTETKTVKVEDTSKIDALKAEIETMKKTAATWQSKATKAEAEKAEAVKSWHVCAGELVKAQAKIDELIEAAKAMKPVKKIFTVKRVKSATEDTATAADKYAECPWDEDIEETTEETTEETNADEDAEEDSDVEKDSDYDSYDFDYEEFSKLLDEAEEIPVETIEKYLDKNGVPFAFKGKCIFAITDQERSLFTMDDARKFDELKIQWGYHLIDDKSTLAEKLGVTELIEEEHDSTWEDGSYRCVPRQFKLIWEGPMGEFDDPAFKHVRTVMCRDYRNDNVPASVLYTRYQYEAATEAEREIMRKEQYDADNEKSAEVEQVGFTGTSDGRIHFYKGYKGFTETYFSFDHWAKRTNKSFYFAKGEEKIEKFKNWLRDFSSAMTSNVEQLQDADCDRAFLKCVIDHFDPRVAREVKKQYITFACPYDMLSFEYKAKTNLCYAEGMSKEEIEEITRERSLLMLSEYGVSAREQMAVLCNAIDAAKVRLHMTDYVGTAR